MFFFQAEDGIRDIGVTGVQTCALPIWFGGSCGVPSACRRNDRTMMMRVNEVTDSRIAAPKLSAVSSRKIFTAFEPPPATSRSEERRVGKEGRSRWSPYH